MNVITIPLSSNSESYSSVEEEITLYDNTTVSINLSGLYDSYSPLYLKIDWGDGSSTILNNSVYKNYREDSIFNEILYGKFDSVFNIDQTHSYVPSISARYKSLSAQVLLEYGNGSITWITIPMTIITGDYYETIKNVELLNTTILPISSNKSIHTFSIDAGGFLIESYG